MVHKDTSSSESESLDHWNDNSDSENKDEANQEIIEDDFVVLKVHTTIEHASLLSRGNAIGGVGNEVNAALLLRSGGPRTAFQL